MRRVSRSVSLVMMPRKRLRCSSSSCGLSRRISEKARIEVSGVRSSCVTVETKSSFSRSSSCSRSFASRSSAVAASSSRDFCSSRWLYTTTCEASSRISRTSSMLERLFLHHRGDHDARRRGADRAGELHLDVVHELGVGLERVVGPAQAARRARSRGTRRPRRAAPRKRAEQVVELGHRRGAAPEARAAGVAGLPEDVDEQARLARARRRSASRRATRRRRRRCWRACSRSWRG